MKAAILVQSDKKATYEAVLQQLFTLNKGIDEIIWIFVESPINRELTPFDKKITGETFATIKAPSDLDRIIKDVSILDVSGLPKENLIPIFSRVVESRAISMYALSRNHMNNQTTYIDLTSESGVNAFRSKVIWHKRIIKVAQATALVGLASMVVLWLFSFDASSTFITWLGIFIGILGTALTFLK